MTPRPLLTHNKRPLSAIFLGNSSSSNSSSSHLPDLPEPPSLGSSPSTTSGLPSPPATNSTGSESTTGGQANTDGFRRPSLSSIKSAIMQNGNKSSSRINLEYRSKTPSDDGDEEFDEDHTAKLSAEDQRLQSKSPPEDTSALQRLKSITKRNRMVLERLAAYKTGSRLSTPSPPNALRSSRSPPSQPHSAAAASTPNLFAPSTSSALRRDRSTSVSILSGSETEREHVSTSHYSSDDQGSPPIASTSNTSFRSLSVRQRRISAPSSPNRARTIHASASKNDQKDLYSSWTSGRRGPSETENDKQTDVTAAALAAVASMRRSPSSAKRRQPLPREFTDARSSLDGRRSIDGKRSDGRQSVDSRRSLDSAPLGEPSTPRRSLDRTRSLNQDHGRASPSPRSHTATINDSPQSPRRRAQRYTTIRDVNRRYQTSSQDMTSPRETPDDGRRQSARGGSDSFLIESLSGGRSIVTESLRAAGLSKRRDNDDVFAGEADLQNSRRLKLNGTLGRGSSSGSRDNLTHTSGSNDSVSGLGEPQTPATAVPLRSLKRHSDLLSSRPVSSMAAYTEELRTTALSRAPQSAVLLSDRQRIRALAEDERRPLSQSQISTPPSAHDRAQSSLGTGSGSGRRGLGTPQSDPGSSATPEHTRLMMNALNMFESHLARLPSMGTTTTVTIPDLFRSAQSIVHSSNTLNNMLRKATTRALEEQIQAEVSDNVSTDELSELWRLVGGDYRDSLRVSDELVRTMTDFLLGVGKLLREATAANTAGRHSRGSSLDENLSRRLTPEIAMSNGNRSSEDRRSGGGSRLSSDTSNTWESHSGERSDNSRRSSSRADLLFQRPSPSLNAIRDPDTNRIKDSLERTSRLALGSSRVFSPRESTRDLPLSASDDSLQVYEPSPTPASRSQTLELRRPLHPVSIPPPLSTLPSESILNRKNTKTHRSKASIVSNATVRASPIFPVSSNSTPTTAISNVTTSVSGSSGKPAQRAIRIDTSESIHHTLSRSSGTALAELQQHFDRDDRQRTVSGGSYTDRERALLSGSETERDTRRLEPSRSRTSLDSNGDIGAATQRNQSERKARRMTVTEIFSRN